MMVFTDLLSAQRYENVEKKYKLNKIYLLMIKICPSAKMPLLLKSVTEKCNSIVFHSPSFLLELLNPNKNGNKKRFNFLANSGSE